MTVGGIFGMTVGGIFGMTVGGASRGDSALQKNHVGAIGKAGRDLFGIAHG